MTCSCRCLNVDERIPLQFYQDLNDHLDLDLCERKFRPVKSKMLQDSWERCLEVLMEARSRIQEIEKEVHGQLNQALCLPLPMQREIHTLEDIGLKINLDKCRRSKRANTAHCHQGTSDMSVFTGHSRNTGKST